MPSNINEDNQQAHSNKVDVLFLTGQPGAGKTAVAKEISELLYQVKEPHAVIDLDELCRGVFPAQSSDFNRSLAVQNLQAVWANFYTAGVRRLILARIIQSLDDVKQFASVIPNSQITICRLKVSEVKVRQRIIEREPGSAQAFLLSVTTHIAAQIANLNFSGIDVDNNDRLVTDVAREILERMAWPHSHS